MSRVTIYMTNGMLTSVAVSDPSISVVVQDFDDTCDRDPERLTEVYVPYIFVGNEPSAPDEEISEDERRANAEVERLHTDHRAAYIIASIAQGVDHG